MAEVEVDLDTFEVQVTGFWSSVDVGKAIHPAMCKGQMEGGTLQAHLNEERRKGSTPACSEPGIRS